MMHIKDNLTNFLYDKNYFINIYDRHVYVFNYHGLVKLNCNIVILQLENFKLIIKGSNLQIIKMSKTELLIEGEIKSVSILND